IAFEFRPAVGLVGVPVVFEQAVLLVAKIVVAPGRELRAGFGHESRTRLVDGDPLRRGKRGQTEKCNENCPQYRHLDQTNSIVKTRPLVDFTHDAQGAIQYYRDKKGNPIGPLT